MTKANQKKRKLPAPSKADVLDKIRIIEKDLQFDAAALFNRKAKSTEDFVEFFRSSIQKKTSSSVEVNALKKVVAFTGGVVLFDRLTPGWLEQVIWG